MDIKKNTVPATQQVHKSNYTEVFDNGGSINILFVGNSITRHEPKSEIGWEYDWGMAASKRENDYVHVVVRMLENKFGKVNYCITNCGEWEKNYYNYDIIHDWEKARNFRADILILRIGENVALEDAHPFAPHYLKMAEYFSSNPNVKVVATGLFWKNEPMDDAIKQVANKKNYTFVPLNDLGCNNANMAIGQFWHQGVAMHPNDEGMRQIAERIVAVL